PYQELPQITARICGICPVSPHLAAAKACDAIAGAEPTRPAALLRELMHMGQFVQSHSMHFFHLAGPDLLLGMDADPAVRNVAGVAQANPDLALKAIRLRAFGQEIIRLLGGKRVHPIFAVPGGVNTSLALEDRDRILGQIPEMAKIIQTGIAVAKQWYEAEAKLVGSFAVMKSGYLGLIDKEGGLQFYDGKIRLADQNGIEIACFDDSRYLEFIGEHVEDWSYLKFPFYRPLGWPGGVYRVGPLGRLNMVDQVGTSLAGKEFAVFRAMNGGHPVEGTLWYHYARLIEDLYAVERIEQLLLEPDVLSKDVCGESTGFVGEGVGCLEAPRGTLIHHYQTDENGLVRKANLIVATGHNNWAMSKSVDMVAKAYVNGDTLTEGMLNRVEAAVRAHDPCLSCSTHALGHMPLVLELVAPDGSVLDRMARGV
ncbi:MAG TPA: Ni/Fe hydrogenase subunit alpha, partial [Armatimonadota bacterium]